MSNHGAVQQRNREVADKLIEDAKGGSQGPPSGAFVGIANGNVVVVTDDLNELGRRLREADPNPSNCFWFEMGRDYSKVHLIWEVA